MAIVTSPRGGLQLDLWLGAMAAMDVVPLAAALATVWSNGEGGKYVTTWSNHHEHKIGSPVEEEKKVL